jgi:hypothetical protein
LEDSLDAHWDRVLPQMAQTTMATQLACLPLFVKDEHIAGGVRVAWSALSRATHHHPYELAPTAEELSAWLDRVEALAELLDSDSI